MCGIAGIIDFAGRPIDESRLRWATSALAHRGPDDHGTWRFHGDGWSVGLAHTRLAVIDPAPEAHQPMLSPDQHWAIVTNGELYNYRELAHELPEPPRTASDTEVFWRACRAWGPAALSRFDGMWSAAIIDTANRRGFLLRDPMGIKPLYYSHVDRKLVFASELKTLVGLLGPSDGSSSHSPLLIDPKAVATYLFLGFIPHPMTIYRHIHKLPPGCMLRFDANGPSEVERYPSLVSSMDASTALSSSSAVTSASTSSTPTPSYDEACREVRRLLESAVHRQCVSDVPLGAFLSGGLDSSAVVACMMAHNSGSRGSRVKTFSIGYAGHPRYDETPYAQQVARHLGTDHHVFHLSFDDVLAAVEPTIRHMGEPFADSSLLPSLIVSRHTRQHVTVALSGDGGDELFGGYWRYLGHHYLARYHRLPGWLRQRVIEPVLRKLPEARTNRRLDRLRQLRKLLRGDLPNLPSPLDRHLAWASFLDNDEATALLGHDRTKQTQQQIRQLYDSAAYGNGVSYSNSGGHDNDEALQAILRADLGICLPSDMLFKVDTASMMFGLEVRVPLLSADLVRYVSALPMSYKIAGTTGKRILRDAVADLLPAEILRRPKMGFEVPVGEFLRNELRDAFVSSVTSNRLHDFGIAPAAALKIYDDHLHRRTDRTELLWALFVLCNWGLRPF